jgi:hypothetical protein
MKKIWKPALILVALAVMAFGALNTGAWWTVQTQAKDNVVQAATFDMTIGGSQGHEVSGVCSFANMAPGDDPKQCKIDLHNAGSIPINVVWSGFALGGDTTMQDYVFLTDFADSNGTTHLADIMSFDSNGDGKLSIKEAAPALGNGYFSDPNSVYGYGSMFLAPTETGWVSLTLAFGSDAPNSTIGKDVNFTWTLTAQQLPKNALP